MLDCATLDSTLKCAIAGERAGAAASRIIDPRKSIAGPVHPAGARGTAGMDALYRCADLVVLTSLSEGIPLF